MTHHAALTRRPRWRALLMWGRGPRALTTAHARLRLAAGCLAAGLLGSALLLVGLLVAGAGAVACALVASFVVLDAVALVAGAAGAHQLSVLAERAHVYEGMLRQRLVAARLAAETAAPAATGDPATAAEPVTAPARRPAGSAAAR